MDKQQRDHGAPDAPLLVSVPDAARLLGVGRTLLWAKARAGEVPTVRLGRRVLVPRAALESIAAGLVAAGDNG